MEQLPERHLDCSECKKPVHTCYTELVGKNVHKLGMCADCPLLRKKLFGHTIAKSDQESKEAGLACGSCGTTIDEVRMGASLGCSLCYEVFEELIVSELSQANRIAHKIVGNYSSPLHMGRSPGQAGEVSPAMKLLSLHQALHETLNREDYEQAAWLRDQIKALTEEKKESDTKKSGEKKKEDKKK